MIVPTLTLILPLIVILPLITMIFLLSPDSKLHRGLVLCGLTLVAIGILEYEIAYTTEVEVITYLALWHTFLAIFILYIAAYVSYLYASPFSKFWSKNGLISILILAIPPIIIIYNIFFNGVVIDTNHELTNGKWQYSINNEGIIPNTFKIWTLIVTSYIAFGHFIAYYNTKKSYHKKLNFILFLIFTIVPFGGAYLFVFAVNGINKGNYDMTIYLVVIFMIISWIYINFKSSEINPIIAIDDILESMSNIIIIVDNDYNIKYANEAIESLGIYRSSITNHSLIKLAEELGGIKPDIFDKFSTLKQGETQEETFSITINDKNIHLFLLVSATHNKKNIKIGYAFAFTNVTETYNTRQQLKFYSAELEQSNKELERFAYVASHDMKAPLRNIISFLSLIERSLKNHPDEELHEFIHYANTNARYMHSLVQDILKFSKISEMDETIEPVDLNDVVSNTMNQLAPYIKKQNAVINVGQLPTIHGRTAQIHQLFQSLIENGIKYNESEQPTIDIQATQKDGYIHITLKDNGIGIPENFYNQIFDMFKRLHNNSVYEGTGIGLAICKKIMEYHQGKIQVASNPEQGVTFTLNFPITN